MTGLVDTECLVTCSHDLSLTPSSVGAESPTRPVRSAGAGAGAGMGSVTAGTVTCQAPPAAQAAAVDLSRPAISPHGTAQGQQQAGMHSSTILCHIWLDGITACQ